VRQRQGPRPRRLLRRLLATLAFVAAPVVAPAAPPPNLLLVVADDLGFSDLGVTGGEIPTPTLDRLAREGVLLTQFASMPTCSPSRAALLTGRVPQRVGLGTMAELVAPNQQGRRGYEGWLVDGVPTVAGALRARGYATYLSGKWHLGDVPGRLPVDRGFERSFALLHGGASHVDLRGYMPQQPRAAYVEDGALIEPPTPFYSSDLFVDRLLGYLQEARRRGDARPFFAYLAFTAPHAPLHAPAEVRAATRARYAAGWDAVRAARHARQQASGLLPADAPLPPRWPMVPAWDGLDAAQQAREVARMSAYAEMVEGLDRSLGRLLAQLEQDGSLADTVVVFLSDNGAEASDFSAMPGIGEWFRRAWNADVARIGRGDSYAFQGAGWAQVSATPNRLFKGLPTSGGTRVPAIVRAPGRFPAGTRIATPTSIVDLAPTLLALAGGTLADVDGGALGRVLEGRSREVRRDSPGLGMELLGNRAWQSGRWKIVQLRAPWGDGTWELYDTRVDPGESRNLAAAQPDVVRALAAQYAAWAQRVGVIEVPAGFMPYPLVVAPDGAPRGPGPAAASGSLGQ
jgi:arylsulfatase